MAKLVITNSSGTVGELTPSWTYNLDATPVAPGDSSGGTGNVSATARAGVDPEFIVNSDSDFAMPGSAIGKVSSVTVNGATSATDSTVSMNLTTRLSALSVVRKVPAVGDFAALGTWRTPAPITPITSAIPGISTNEFNPAPHTVLVYEYDPLWGMTYYFYSQNGQRITNPFGSLSADAGFKIGSTVSSAVFTPNGDLWFTQSAGTLRKYPISVSGSPGVINVWNPTYTTYGSSGSGNGQFANPLQIDTDSTGNLYVADSGNSRVQKISSAGSYVTKVGTPGSGTSQFNALNGVAVDRNTDTVYAVDTGNNRIQRFTNNLIYIDSIVPPAGWSVVSISAVNGSIVAGLVTTSAASNSAHALARVNATAGTMQLMYVNPVSENLLWLAQTGDRALYAMTGLGVGFSAGAYKFVEFLSATSQLSAVIRSYINMAIGPQTGDISMGDRYMSTYSLSAVTPDPIPAWEDNVWNKLKELCTAYAVSISPTGKGFVVNDLSQSVLLETNFDNIISDSASITLDSQSIAQKFVMTSYNTTSGWGVLYDAKVVNKTFSIGVNEFDTEVLILPDYPFYIQQPTQVVALPGDGQYMIIDSTANAPVTLTLQQWKDYGGSVSVAISRTIPNAIELTLSGPFGVIPGTTAPYKLASNSVTPALSILGSGVFTTPKDVTIYTSANADTAPTEFGPDVKNIFIGNEARMYDRAAWRASQMSGPLITVNMGMPKDQNGFNHLVGVGYLLPFKESMYRVINISYNPGIGTLTLARHVTIKNILDKVTLNPVANRNLASNPSFETNTNGYTVIAAGGGTFAVSQTAVTPFVGSFAMRISASVTASTATAITINPATDELKSGDSYYVGYMIRSSFAGNFRARLRTYSLTGGTGTAANIDGVDVLVAANTWTLISISGVVPAGVQSAQPMIRGGGVAETFPSGATLDIDAVLVSRDGNTTYFSGSNASAAAPGVRYTWDSTANASASTRQSGYTNADFAALWAGKTLKDIKIKPLRPIV